MNELEKCMAGINYNCHHEIFLGYKQTARTLLVKYNTLPYDQKQEKQQILTRLFGSIGTNVSVGLPFICDYGCNIRCDLSFRCLEEIYRYPQTTES